METSFIIFAALAILLLAAIVFEAFQIRKYNQQFPEIAEKVEEIVTVLNTNTEIQKNDRLLNREAAVDIAMIKQVLEIHAKILEMPIPTKQWDDLMEVVKEASA